LLTGGTTLFNLAEMKREETKYLGLRIPTDLWIALEQEAKKEHRDVAKTVRMILKKGVPVFFSKGGTTPFLAKGGTTHKSK